MEELELGNATIVYEDPEDGTVEETVENEQLVYVRDHWAIKAGTDESGNDLMRQVPRDRVYRVERNVEKFEHEARSVRHRVESIANEVGRIIPVGGNGGGDGGGGLGGGLGGGGRSREEETQDRRIPVETGGGEGTESSRGSERSGYGTEDSSVEQAGEGETTTMETEGEESDEETESGREE